MNTLKINKAAIVLLLALTMLFGNGLVASMTGLDLVPQTHACAGGGTTNGGGC